MLKGKRTIEKSMSQPEIDAKFAFYMLKEAFGLVKAGSEIPEILLNEIYDTYNADTNRVCTTIRVAMHLENYIVEVAEKVYSKGIRAPWSSETDTILQKKIKLMQDMSVIFAVSVAIARNLKQEPWVSELLNECSQLAIISERAMKKYKALCGVVRPEYRYINQGGKINE